MAYAQFNTPTTQTDCVFSHTLCPFIVTFKAVTQVSGDKVAFRHTPTFLSLSKINKAEQIQFAMLPRNPNAKRFSYGEKVTALVYQSPGTEDSFREGDI